MNALITTATNEVTMTSLEMVEYINSQRGESEAVLAHSDFLKKVPQVLGETVAGNFSFYYKASNGKQNPMYRFPKREACLMAMSYSYDLQAKIFDKMTELEQKASPVDPLQWLNDPSALRKLLSGYTERVQALEDVVATQGPKVQALDRIATTDGTMNPTVAAKVLQIQPKILFDWLRANRWIYTRPGGSGNVGYQERIQQGLLTHKVTIVHRPDGTEKVVEQVLITSKGLARIAEAFAVPVSALAA